MQCILILTDNFSEAQLGGGGNVTMTDIESRALGNWPQIRGPYIKGPLQIKCSIQVRGKTGHNISITALLDFKKIIHFFNISLFLKH